MENDFNDNRLVSADLLSDKERRACMGKAAREWVGENFSAENMAQQVSQLYLK